MDMDDKQTVEVLIENCKDMCEKHDGETTNRQSGDSRFQCFRLIQYGDLDLVNFLPDSGG